MPVPDEIIRLVENFDRNLAQHRHPNFNESQVRRDFIDPFFAALGWDIDNRSGLSNDHRQVILEESVRVTEKVKEQEKKITRHPDYSFRDGGKARFFVEAKKPSEKLSVNPDHARQVRNYGWSAGLPLCILTDFEEFIVYDCRIQPSKGDSPLDKDVVVFRCEYKDYAKPEVWEQIHRWFAYGAESFAAYQEYANKSKPKKTPKPVQTAFLQQLDEWRVKLAKDIALHNVELRLKPYQLSEAVQKTLDRLIFLKICEDRGIEAYESLKNQMGTKVYGKLRFMFNQADQRYNSGLFHFSKEKGRDDPDTFTLDLTIGDEVLNEIIAGLYDPYEFSVIPVEILGQIYEQFLGKVITINGGAVSVDLKPEVRKAGGVYYTPQYIVDYIVQNTVGKLLEGKTPEEAAKLRILDPACGSGSFLLGAYRYLLDWHLKWYSANNPKKQKGKVFETDAQEWRLTTAEKKRILLNNLYGVDIDAQAVEVTKLSLLMKVLEGESEGSVKQFELFRERVLPDLDANIKCGNSLIGMDFYHGKQLSMFEDEEKLKINAFDWDTEFSEIIDTGGFDVIIGNPPYDVLEKDRKQSSWPHTILQEYVRSRTEYKSALGGKLNLFRFFIVRSLFLLKDAGRFGMIVPLALLADISCASSRRHLMLSTTDTLADCFPQKDNRNRRVFPDAKLSTCVITTRKTDEVSKDIANINIRIFPGNSFLDNFKESTIFLHDTELIDPKNTPIPLTSAKHWETCKKIHKASNVKRLGDVKDFDVRRGEINQTIYRKFITSVSTMSRLLKGVEVGQYHIKQKLSQGHQEWLDEALFLKENTSQSIVHERRIATQRITGVDEKLRIVATLIDPKTYFADSTNSISIASSSMYSLHYLLGLLNSKLFQWRFKITSTNNNVGTNELDSMPFRTINFDDPIDKEHYDNMVNLVNQILDLQNQFALAISSEQKKWQRRMIEDTEKQIDALVYELYGLTDEEIKIVEGS